MVLYGYVIMSNRIHLIVPFDRRKLSSLTQYFKKNIAKSILDKIQNSPESLKESILERFKLTAQNIPEIKTINFSNRAIMRKIFFNKFMWTK
jgi:hypothetical protein